MVRELSEVFIVSYICLFFRLFYMIYVWEMIVKMIALGISGYFKSNWNILDFAIIIMATGG